MWKKRTNFRTQSRSFKPPEDTIFRPVAPFNVFSVQEGSEYITRNKLLAPQNGLGEVQIASAFTMLDEKTAKEKAKQRKMTVHMTSGSHLFKLRLKVEEFSMALLCEHLTNVGVQNFMLGIQDKKNKKKPHDSINNESEFQKHLRNAWKQKRILELAILTSKRRRRTKNTYDSSWEQPRKRVKKESGTSLLRASRKRREKKARKRFEDEDFYQRPATPRNNRRRKKKQPVVHVDPPSPVRPLTPPPAVQVVIEEAEEPPVQEEEALYQVEMILDDRFSQELQRQEWLVKWEGYTVEESTWEPLANVDGNVKFADYQDAKAAEPSNIADMSAAPSEVKENAGEKPSNIADVWF